jgi:hypothetical protein
LSGTYIGYIGRSHKALDLVIGSTWSPFAIDGQELSFCSGKESWRERTKQRIEGRSKYRRKGRNNKCRLG